MRYFLFEIHHLDNRESIIFALLTKVHKDKTTYKP